MNVCVGSIAFFLFGYCVAYGELGENEDGFLGDGSVALTTTDGNDDFSQWSHFFISWAYATTACTIVSGAVAGRSPIATFMTFTGLVFFSFLLSFFFVPYIKRPFLLILLVFMRRLFGILTMVKLPYASLYFMNYK